MLILKVGKAYRVAVWQLLAMRLKIRGSHFRWRSSRPEVFCRNSVLRNFAKFIGKHLCQSLFFNKVAASCRQLKQNFNEYLFYRTHLGNCFLLVKGNLDKKKIAENLDFAENSNFY